MQLQTGVLVISAAIASAALAQQPAGQAARQGQSAPVAQQRRQRPAIPRETCETVLGGKKVSVEYGRPALEGRTIDALLSKLPSDRVWRAGANQVTTLTTEGDIMIGNARVPAGKYSLYVYAPTEGNWALIVNRDPGVPLKTIFPAAPPEMADALWPRLDGYAKIADQEVARIELRPGKPAEAAERFRITIEPPRNDASTLTLAWGDRAWTVGVRPATRAGGD
jgi:hypothetical protein